jgi:hypothetical protein
MQLEAGLCARAGFERLPKKGRTAMRRIVFDALNHARFGVRPVIAASFLLVLSACGADDNGSATGLAPVAEPGPVSVQLGLSELFDPYIFLVPTRDDAGAGDAPDQSDMNSFTRADNVAGRLAVAWTWDDINSWGGAGQSGDACALFDTDAEGTPASQGGGNADYALCVRINNPGPDPNIAAQLPAQDSPILYQCSDKKTDRCTTTFSVLSLGGSFCEVVMAAETFNSAPNLGDDGADVLAACSIALSAIGNPSRANLLNVCSFPSGSPNSNNFDCVVTPGSGFLQIKKSTSPQSSTQTFSFTLSPAASGGTTAFNITDNSSGDETTSLIPVAPGTYSISETVPTGWVLSNATCTGGTSTANPITGITVAVGETKVCTFTNSQSSSITIVKDAAPNDLQDFAFTGNITGCTSFTLDDDSGVAGADDTNSNQKVCGVAAGTYNVGETVPEGWVQTSAICSDGSPISSINLAAGENITCTFVNTKNGSITIVKNATPNDEQDFAFAGTITGCTSFTLDDDAGATGETGTNSHEKVCAVALGTFNVDETVPTGWTQTSATCSNNSPITAITVAAGEAVTCTFVNTKRAKLRIVKATSPDADPTEFVFTPTNWNSGATFMRHDNQAGFESAFLAPGTTDYTTVETVPGGWALTNRACVHTVGGAAKTFSSPANGITVQLAAGEDVTCTFTNTKGGSITIVKDADPNDLQDFAFAGSITGCTSFTLDDDAGVSNADDTNLNQKVCGVVPGTYNVDETVPSGWVKTSATCSDGSPITAIDLGAGENITCTFTNTKQAKLRIVKATSPDADPTEFVFTPTNWNSDATFMRHDNQAGFESAFLDPGATDYTTVETVPGGWTLTNRNCVRTVGGAVKTFSSPANGITVHVTAGEDITCTFTNTKNGQITIVKDAVPNALQDFVFAGDITGCASFTLDDDDAVTGADNTNSNQKVCSVAPGTFYVDETVPGGWAKTSATCSDGSPITAIAVSAGENITCTFVNTVVTPAINVTKSATPGAFSAVSGVLPSGFAAKDTFRVNPTSPGAGTPNFASATCDDKGANDINSSQVDLNCFNRADNVADRIYVRWTWDDINAWSGGGSTGDACALLDTDNDGNTNLAVCARIQNDADGNIVQIGGNNAADVYVCNDTKTDRCAKQVTQLTGSAKGATKCTILSPVPDGFPGLGDDGSDVQATCEIDRAMVVNGSTIPATTDLLNVCSFPSGEPNSNPFDCVVTIGSGFIQIVKGTNMTTQSLFGFTLGSTANSNTTNYIIQGGGVASALLPVPPTAGSLKYKLSEVVTSSWTLTTATCVVDGGSAGIYKPGTRGFDDIIVKSGQTTICTFTNNGSYTTNVNFTIEVENTGTVGVTLTYLNDSVFGTVASLAECNALGTLAPGAKYSCTFTRPITGLPNATHSNTVTARASDIPTNSTVVEDTATAQFSFPP